jgi:hypothetical protein
LWVRFVTDVDNVVFFNPRFTRNGVGALPLFEKKVEQNRYTCGFLTQTNSYTVSKHYYFHASTSYSYFFKFGITTFEGKTPC